MDLRFICRWFKCAEKYACICLFMFAQYANDSANLLFCTAFALDVKVCKPVIFRMFTQLGIGYHGWSNFHNWTRLLCIANVTKLSVLNMLAHEANVSKHKLWTNFLVCANLIKHKILLVAANVVKSQGLNKVAWAVNLIKLLLFYNFSLR